MKPEDPNVIYCPVCGTKMHKAGFSRTRNRKQIYRCNNPDCLKTVSGKNVPKS